MSMFTTTEPRESESRWLRPRTDEVAVYKGTTNPVRTVEIAALTDLVEWLPVFSAPRLTTLPGEITAFSIDLGGAEPCEVIWREREQIVYRERIALDPWDVESAGNSVECRGMDGACYLPSGHPGQCDPDVVPTIPAYAGPVSSSDDIAALVEIVAA